MTIPDAPDPGDRRWTVGGPDETGASLVQRLKSDHSQAFQDLLTKYSQRLIQVAGQRMGPGLQRRFDPEDVLQSAYRTFYRRHQGGQFQIETSRQLWNLLVRIVICKTQSYARKHTAGRRSVRAEERHGVPLESFLADPATPEEGLALWEEIDRALHGLPEQAGDIFHLRLQGEDKTAIARQLDLSRQTVHRTLRLIHDRLESRFTGFLDEDGSPPE